MAVGVPLQGVQAQQDTLAQKQRGPHDHVPDWTSPTVVQNEIKDHAEAHEQEEHNWVEESKADPQGVFMDQRRHHEHRQHGRRFKPPAKKPEEVPIGVVEEPIMDDHIPGAIIVCK